MKTAAKAICAIVAVCASANAGSQTPRKTNITVFDPPGSTATFVAGINDAGQIVGEFGNGAIHGFMRNPDGTYATFDIQGSSKLYPIGINASGVITGFYWLDSDGTWHGFIRSADGSQITSIDPPGSTFTEALSINASGEIVGWFDDSQHQHGFLLGSDGTYTALDFPGASGTSAYSINDAGEIAGTYTMSSHVYGYVYSGVAFTTIDVPGSSETYASSIDENGTVSGWYTMPKDRQMRIFIYDNNGLITTASPCRKYLQLSTQSINEGTLIGGCGKVGFVRLPGGSISIIKPPYTEGTYPTGINSSGVIAGQYEDYRIPITIHGFFLTAP